MACTCMAQAGVIPTNTFQGTNYWVDVVFTAELQHGHDAANRAGQPECDRRKRFANQSGMDSVDG